MTNKIIAFLLGLFFFLLPLYFLPFGNLGVESDKQALVILFSLVLFFLLVKKTLLSDKIKIITTPFTLPLFLLVLAYLTSNLITAPNKIDSLISPMGTSTMIAILMLYFVFTQLFPDSKFLILSSKFLVFSSCLVSLLYLLLQLPITNYKLPIPISPLGNPLSAFIFLLPLAVFLGAQIILPFSSSKKPVFSFTIIKPLILPFLAFLLIISATLVLGFHLVTDQKPALLPFSSAWSIMMEEAKDFPKFLFGVGPGNFISAFSIAKPLTINSTPLWNILLTSSSDLPFTIATEAGIIAAAIFIYMMIKIYLLAIKNKVATGDVDYHNISQAYLLALITAIILQLLVPSNVALFTLTIFLLSAVFPKKEIKFNLKIAPAYLLFPLGLVSLIGIILGGKFYLADLYYRGSVISLNRQKVADAYNLSQAAIKFNPSSDRYYALSSSLSLSIAGNLSQSPQASESATNQNIVQLTQQAVTHARNATVLNSQNPQNWAQLAAVYQTLIGSVQGADQSTLDAISIQIGLEPVSPQPRLVAANVFTATGQLSAAQALLREAINLKPDWATPHYNLAGIFAQTQNYQQSALELQKVLDLIPIDSDDYKKIEQQLTQIKDLIPKESTPSSPPTGGSSGQAPSATPSSTPGPAKKPTPTP